MPRQAFVIITTSRTIDDGNLLTEIILISNRIFRLFRHEIGGGNMHVYKYQTLSSQCISLKWKKIPDILYHLKL